MNAKEHSCFYTPIFIKIYSYFFQKQLFSFSCFSVIFLKKFYLLILGVGGREGERERGNIDLLFHYLCIHWWFLICVLAGDCTCNLGVLGRHSNNQLSYQARATFILISTTYLLLSLYPVILDIIY